MPAKLIVLLGQAIELYSGLLMIWVIGSWFPRLHSTGFYRWVNSVVYPYARLFQGIIPPLGQFDFSIVFAFILLRLVGSAIQSSLVPNI